MKDRLNITIDHTLIEQAKRYAAKNNTSLSQLIEEILRKLVSRPKPKKETFLEFMAKMPKPKGNFDQYSKETYYEDNKSKYGF